MKVILYSNITEIIHAKKQYKIWKRWLYYKTKRYIYKEFMTLNKNPNPINNPNLQRKNLQKNLNFNRSTQI